MSLIGKRHISPAERFDQQTIKADFGCWHWKGSMAHNGYGMIMIEGKHERAHRYAYERYRGKIPDGMLVLHKCDNSSCVNPDHLFLGTTQDNSDDKVAKGRQAKGEALAKAQGNYERCGENNGNSKLCPGDIVAIRGSEKSQRAIAKMYGVSQATIFHIKTKKTWRHIK
mgnify:CR=1 FL=1